jgi:hypothetical protein
MMTQQTAGRGNHQQQNVLPLADSSYSGESSPVNEAVHVNPSRLDQGNIDDGVRPSSSDTNRTNERAFNQAPFVYRE